MARFTKRLKKKVRKKSSKKVKRKWKRFKKKSVLGKVNAVLEGITRVAETAHTAARAGEGGFVPIGVGSKQMIPGRTRGSSGPLPPSAVRIGGSVNYTPRYNPPVTKVIHNWWE